MKKKIQQTLPCVAVAVQILGIMVIAVGIVALAGYVANRPWHTWPAPNTVAMALPTSLCFVAVGAALILIGGNARFRPHGRAG